MVINISIITIISIIISPMGWESFGELKKQEQNSFSPPGLFCFLFLLFFITNLLIS